MQHSLVTSSKKTLSTSQKSSSDESKNTTTKMVDPFEKRLNHIRIYILNNNKKQRHIIPCEPTLVFEKFLYLGGLKSLQDKDRLDHLNITHILSVVWIRPRIPIRSHIKHMFIKADDTISFDMSPHFEQACQFIDEARQLNSCVLVHCACGVSRSTTMCCAYLMKYHSMSVEQAMIHLRSRRHIVQPNTAFLRQLIHYNEQIECDRTTMNTVLEQSENV
ncbi:unnamed protein product [Adineta steineri]|uniref:protein-tyrosine-phosphatase n=1 Tax=Adineta steineri TaxID=433720 RepID=A0A814PLC8_9BILA|nr:unnamed protein product [Adineta steineri]CAF3629796.1 unnamed protein product [Adineta steineri]